MSKDYDPRSLILDKLENRFGITNSAPAVFEDRMQPLATKAGIRVFGPDYLLAVYDRAGQKTRSNIIVPKEYIEDKAQGKVALVVGIGPLCQGEEYENWFGGHPPQIGDWVVTSIRDGLSFLVDDITMKLVEYKYLRMTTVEPDIVM